VRLLGNRMMGRDWTDYLASPARIRICDSPPPDESPVDALWGQFDKTDGDGIASFVRSDPSSSTLTPAVTIHVRAKQPVTERRMEDRCAAGAVRSGADWCRRHPGCSGEQRGQDVHRSNAVLGSSREVGADLGQALSAFDCAEESGDLGLQLHHAKVRLGLIV